jgi:hypothetical protein
VVEVTFNIGQGYGVDQLQRCACFDLSPRNRDYQQSAENRQNVSHCPYLQRSSFDTAELAMKTIRFINRCTRSHIWLYDEEQSSLHNAQISGAPQLRVTLKLIFLTYYPLVLAAQTGAVMPLASEPHHHLLLHNEYANVYQVQVGPHDSVLLHRHDFDAISVMLNDSQVTVYTPGKPGARRKLIAGQIRLQPRGYVHSTTIDGDATYRNVTIELLLPQEGEHNLCFEVIPDKPLHCSAAEAANSQTGDQLQLESDESSVNLMRVLPQQNVTIGHPQYPELVVALDANLATEGGAKRSLNSGDFVWLEAGKAPQFLKNNGDKESHVVVFTFRPH